MDVTQGPNERRALEYLDAFLGLPIINDEEKSRVMLAKAAILKGRFQNLQRDVNKLKKATTKVRMQPAVLLETLMRILNGYPLQEPDDTTNLAQLPSVVTPQEPKIIISESFSA